MVKDVTPQKRNSKQKKGPSLFQRVGISLISGALGGALVIGGYGYYDNNINTTKNSQNNDITVVEDGKTSVSKVNLDINSDITAAVEKVEDAVVSVSTFTKQQADLSDFEKIFGELPNQKESESNSDGDLEEASEGSGVIYRKNDGKAYIVTNNHVVAGADAVSIMMNNGKNVDATIVGTDVYSDLAVLEIDDKDVVTVAEFGNSDNVKVGEPVLAIGSPLGSSFANSVSQGIISAKDRMITNQTDDGQIINSKAIQTDAAINPGNSGGALVNTAGQVVGINSSKIAQAASGVSAEGMGFAIPSNEVVNIINQLEEGKKVARPMLGVSMVNLSNISLDEQRSILDLTDDSINGGVVVATVQPDSPAATAGLKEYDVITELDGQAVLNSSELQSVLYSKSIGDSLEVTYYRNGKKENTTVILDQDSSKLTEITTSSEPEEIPAQ